MIQEFIPEKPRQMKPMIEKHVPQSPSLCRRVSLCILLTVLASVHTLIAQSSENKSKAIGLRINELLASNASGLRDEQGDTSDWIELWNSNPQQLQLSGYHLTDDLNVLDKWSIPESLIQPKEHLLVWMSGKSSEVLSQRLSPQSARSVPFAKTLIDANERWKYYAIQPGVDQQRLEKLFPLRWTEHDDRFSKAQAGFGYGDDDDRTVIPKGTNIVLLRHKFSLDQDFASRSLGLRIDYDDGFIAYLNGQRVAARNAHREALNQKSLANNTHEAGEPEYIDLSPHSGLLRKGSNVFAIAALNNSSDSSDLSIHPVLGLHAPVLHANFKLKKKGAALYLIAPDGTVADQVSYRQQREDQSFGRSEPDGNSWVYFLTPTPGDENATIQHSSPGQASLRFNPHPGSYQQKTPITIHANSTAPIDIRYTTDGTEPTKSSLVFEDPISFNKTGLIRAAAFVDSERASSILTGTYVIGTQFKLPILSITMTPADFRDVQLQNSATGHSSERPAVMEYISQSGTPIIKTGFGIRLHGGAGRNGSFETKKSYRAYFRKRYGVGRFDGDIIPEAKVKSFDKVVLRASSNDRAPHGSSIRDQVIRDLHADMGALAASGSWGVLHVNGVNRGVYNITERMDEEFLSSHLGKGTYEVMKTGDTILSGDRKDWDDLRRFVERTDFTTDKEFEKLSQRVDIGNLTSYVIVNMCLQNFDWPHNNWYAARRQDDGKWIFLCWDSEWGLGYRLRHDTDAPMGIDLDPYAFLDSGGGYGNGLIRSLFLNLLENPGYRDYYQNEVRRYLNGPLSTENIIRQIRRHRDAIAEDLRIEYELQNQDIQRWHALIQEIEEFAETCPQFFQQHTDDYFQSTIEANSNSLPATIVETNQELQIIQRKTNGTFHRLRSQSGENVWKQETLSLPNDAGTPTGSPKSFTIAPKKTQLIFRDTEGKLHTLDLSRESKEPKHQNLTDLLNLSLTDNDPSLVVINEEPHIVYVDRQSRIHEVWWSNGRWHQHPLPAAPRPGSAPNISAHQGSLLVSYQTSFGAPCEQSLRLDESTDTERPWRHRITHRIPCYGSPIGLSIDGKRRLIFRPRENWPSSEPFVFSWNGRDRPGYKEFKGPRNSFVQAWDQGQRFRHLAPLGRPSFPPAGNPVSIHNPKENQHYLTFRDTSGHIQEAHYVPASQSQEEYWKIEDLTALTQAPVASTDPIGYLNPKSQWRHYLFFDENSQLQSLQFSDHWRHRPLPSHKQQ